MRVVISEWGGKGKGGREKDSCNDEKTHETYRRMRMDENKYYKWREGVIRD